MKKFLLLMLLCASMPSVANYHINLLWAVRPFCTSPGFVIPVLEKLAIGPMLSECEINAQETRLRSSGLGGVVLYSLSNPSIYDEGLMLAVNFFSQQSTITSDLGSTAAFDDVTVGTYLGYQFLLEPGFSFWGGIGILAIVPSLVNKNITPAEAQVSITQINEYVAGSFKLSPTLMVGWIF